MPANLCPLVRVSPVQNILDRGEGARATGKADGRCGASNALRNVDVEALGRRRRGRLVSKRQRQSVATVDDVRMEWIAAVQVQSQSLQVHCSALRTASARIDADC